MKREDGLPGLICNDCIFTVNLFINFKEQCQKAEAQLRKVLYNPPEIYGEYKTVTVLGDNISTIIEFKNACPDSESNDKVVTVINEPNLSGETENNLEPTPLKCDKCGRTFKLEATLKNHLLKHEKSHKCEVCNKEFSCKFFCSEFNKK